MKSSKQHLKRAIILISVLFALSFVVAGFHHHDDAIPHSDCPICVASGVFTIQVTFGDAGVVFHPNAPFIHPAEVVLNHSCVLNPAIAYRAPPQAFLA
jgi:hypothetical protein